MNSIKFSVIIPYKEPNSYLYECLTQMEKQSYKNYEIILLPDKKEKVINKKVKVVSTGVMGPGGKRDIGARNARGEIFAFIDDDAYPDNNWLRNTLKHFENPAVAAVCGPGVTPPADDIFQQASGWVNSLWIGSGGAGSFCFIPKKKRYVDDYPSMNFLVRKKDFVKAGGFDTHFWPGEDTKFCHDLVYGLKKKILYDPKVLVYHHRRELFPGHFKQISRYAIHRGHFARILPETSFRLGYLIPTFFVIFLISGVFLSLYDKNFLYLYLTVISIYSILLIWSVVTVIIKSKSYLVGIFTGIGIFLTHILYGILFPYGFFKKSLKQ